MVLGLNVKEDRNEAINELLNDYEELYVVDVILVDVKKNESINQWYIYSDIKDAKNYLDLCKAFYENNFVIHTMEYIERDENELPFLKYEYGDKFTDNRIRETFKVTKIARAA